MSYDAPAYWHGPVKELLARAGQMDECATKQVRRRVADDFESHARTAEQPFLLNPVSKIPVVPADVGQFAPRKHRMSALPANAPHVEIPSFLKRGPRAEE
jgi:hypothetical protein